MPIDSNWANMIIPSLPAIPSPTFNPPTPSFPNLQGSENVLATLLGRNGPDCTDVSRYRTTTNIVLSCLATILACTWVALHLNAPKSDKGMWKSFWRRFGWMLVALIAPELIAGIAIKERLAAKKYMDEWNANFLSLCSPRLVEIRGQTSKQYERELKNKNYDSRWTLTHGFLAGMGGIRLYDDNNKKPKKFRPGSKFFEDPRMRPIIQQIGLISLKDIEDKSKGDWMSKFFVLIQTTWFIVQCLARWAIHLPVTELEVVTLAYAVQNIFIYFLWWNKPQSLSVPYRLYLEKGGERSEQPEAKGGGKQEEVPLIPRSMSPTVADEAPNTDSLPKPETRRGRSRRARRRSHLTNEVAPWVQPTHSGVQGFFMGLFGGDGYWLFLLLAGTIFGTLHLIPLWLSEFPTVTEKRLWQVSAFYVTVSPLGLPVAGLVVFLVIGTALCCCCFDTEDFATGLTAVFACCATVAYAVARIILLVLPFTTLRMLPSEAFLSVEWTRFIPHF